MKAKFCRNRSNDLYSIFPPLSLVTVDASDYDTEWVFGIYKLKINYEVIKIILVLAWTTIN